MHLHDLKTVICVKGCDVNFAFCYNITFMRVSFKVYIEKIQGAIVVFVISLFYLHRICRYGHVVTFRKKQKMTNKGHYRQHILPKNGIFPYYEIVREQ